VNDEQRCDYPIDRVTEVLARGAHVQHHGAPGGANVADGDNRGRAGGVRKCLGDDGAACGGIAGTVSLLSFTSSSLAGAALGGLSSAVIGGLIGFLGARFVEILRTSLREAIAAERSSAIRGRRG
jgi:hypothetical protein